MKLAPKEIATRLFAIDPDRDERASQICAEVLLTLFANDYSLPENELLSPKLRRFSLRSLVFGVNFLAHQQDELVGGQVTVSQFGELLAAGQDFHGSENLALVRNALQNLVDPSTEQGQKGQHLLMPFHEALLWYDARAVAGKYTTRKVRMRGSGITLARVLLDPPGQVGEGTRELGLAAVAGIQDALTVSSPLAEAAMALEAAMPLSANPVLGLEEDERQAWALGCDIRVAALASNLCRHAAGIVGQGSLSGPAKLWQLRSMLALDLAVDTLRNAWDVTDVPKERQVVLLAIAGPDRQSDRTRLLSERSFADARHTINGATIRTIETVMRELHEGGGIDWDTELDKRTRAVLEDAVVRPYRGGGSPDLGALAQRVFETASYGRASEGFRVLLESIGMSAGGTRYRYLSASPDLLGALVGALSSEMPMTSQVFFQRIRDEWGLVLSPEAAGGTGYAESLDGASLAINARRFERLMIDAGLASGLSDRTVMIGEDAGRRER